ncbi:MAG: virulence RhuM family protein [Kiritimatiellae bacterium]|nr:virulence RhuM family protein [Kiritimatiellia bacterium]
MSRDGRVWLSQKQMAELFGVSKMNISLHVAHILKEGELDGSVVKPYFTTAADGKRYKVAYYALEMILAVGFRVRGVRGTQFRQWAAAHLGEYLVKGFTMDDERLKNPDGRPDYFDELLARIRDIRASEKRFYQKVRDLFALSSDYRGNEEQTWRFFAEVQNKLLFAATGQTAAELVVSRSDPGKPNMGLTSWNGGIVRKEDVAIAKNYLTADEIDTLNRIAVLFLETAELRVKRRMELTLPFWVETVDGMLSANLFEVLRGPGRVSHDEAVEVAAERYEEFDGMRRREEARLADEADLNELRLIEAAAKRRGRDGRKADGTNGTGGKEAQDAKDGGEEGRDG